MIPTSDRPSPSVPISTILGWCEAASILQFQMNFKTEYSVISICKAKLISVTEILRNGNNSNDAGKEAERQRV